MRINVDTCTKQIYLSESLLLSNIKLYVKARTIVCSANECP